MRNSRKMSFGNKYYARKQYLHAEFESLIRNIDRKIQIIKRKQPNNYQKSVDALEAGKKIFKKL